MLKSMTAYGRATYESTLGRFTVEIQSINRKHLDINVLLPRELARFDVDVKKWMSSLAARGQITIKFSVVFNEQIPLKISANIPLVQKIHESVLEIASILKLKSSEELTLRFLSEQPNVLLFDEHMEDEDLYRETLQKVFDLASQDFLKMKTQEGHAIYIDIAKRLTQLHQDIKHIAQYAPQATLRYRERLKERLKEFSLGTIADEERLLKEIGIFAERIDISEEITLFEAHLKEFSEAMTTKKQEAIAKTLEFIIQEMNREINTIGSKSSELEVSKRVIEVKANLERIREIIQNVE